MKQNYKLKSILTSNEKNNPKIKINHKLKAILFLNYEKRTKNS